MLRAPMSLEKMTYDADTGTRRAGKESIAARWRGAHLRQASNPAPSSLPVPTLRERRAARSGTA